MDTTAKKKTTLTPDDMQMIGEYVLVAVKEAVAPLDQKANSLDQKVTTLDQKVEEVKRSIVPREELFTLIKDAVGEVVKEQVTEQIGRLPTREEFSSRMDKQAALYKKHEHEMILLTHQYQRHDTQISALENDVDKLKKNKKKTV